jgi:hypothetical protein
MLIAEGLISPGGPSAPVWAFLSAITLAVLAIIGQQLKAKSDLRQLREQSEMAQSEATKAHKSAEKAQANTANISNGFASSVLGKLERIELSQQKTEEGFRNHLQWHLENDRK